jgi:hypothetical protein
MSRNRPEDGDGGDAGRGGIDQEPRRGKTPKGELLHRHDVEGRLEGRVEIPEPHEVLLTGAYCPNGCQLISPDGPAFEGYPGITLIVEAKGESSTLVLSPFQGDHRRVGPELEEGSLVTLRCPSCGVTLQPVAPCPCGGQYLALYTVQVPDPDYMVGICSRWGCFRSFLKDAGRIVTEYRIEGSEKGDEHQV